MSNDDEKKTLTLSPTSARLSLTKISGGDQVRQSFSHGRSKTVTVERRRKRILAPNPAQATSDATASSATADGDNSPTHAVDVAHDGRAKRFEALQNAIKLEKEQAVERASRVERDALLKIEAEAQAKRGREQAKRREAESVVDNVDAPDVQRALAEPVDVQAPASEVDRGSRHRAKAEQPSRPSTPPKRLSVPESRAKRRGKLTVNAALSGDSAYRRRSVAAMKRAAQKEKRKQQTADPQEKISRVVVLPEVITIQDLANRMAERSGQVVKTLMKLGVMATITQTIEADVAELAAVEMGHSVKRISDADVEIGLDVLPDAEEALLPRPPVVTIMGHVDHGKTSLLDALRAADVAAREVGGITQHIGAYQLLTNDGRKITFIDTPGHEAFTAMRARGATITDIVVLVVAADDSLMPQTIEAIHHAKAAQVPIMVAVNKMDKPGADPNRVYTDLLNHEVVVEQMSGDVLAVEVSAKQRTNLDKLEEAILLQAELLNLRANPNRPAEGVIVEARMETGRGPVGSVLVRHGTLRVGDVFVAGSEYGRVRAMVDDKGQRVEVADPSCPVEVLGLKGVPRAGDKVVATADEARAREVAAYRQRRESEAQAVKSARGTMEQMFAKIQDGDEQELPVVIKGDVQGSVEAIVGALDKIGSDAARVRVLHAAVGAVSESDVMLARASDALVIGFNVRSSPKARDLAHRNGVEVQYYSIIYDMVEAVRQRLTGILVPTYEEDAIGRAEIREIFSVSKVGKVAGCMVLRGVVRAGCKVRLLRDDVVVYEGTVGHLKRFKDDVKEVRESLECGMSLVNYQDMRPGDVFECFEMREIAAVL